MGKTEACQHVDRCSVEKENIPAIIKIQDMGAYLGLEGTQREIVCGPDNQAMEIRKSCRIFWSEQDRWRSCFKFKRTRDGFRQMKLVAWLRTLTSLTWVDDGETFGDNFGSSHA